MKMKLMELYIEYLYIKNYKKIKIRNISIFNEQIVQTQKYDRQIDNWNNIDDKTLQLLEDQDYVMMEYLIYFQYS